MIPLEEAQLYVLGACPPAKELVIARGDALGCVLASAITAREAVPAFDNTSMDGYAVRAADTQSSPVQLRVVEELPAGRASTRAVLSGEAVQVMTGAPIPEGADAVVNVEETSRDAEAVTVRISVPSGLFIRRRGSDVELGTTVLDAGTELQAADLGVLASLGEQTVPVYPRLRVGTFSTGDELVVDGSPLEPGQVREANKDMLLALVAQANCVPVDLGLVRDDEDELTEALTRGMDECDALITSGGVSMGEYDFVKIVLDKLGEMRWMQIAIQPARPFAFGLLRGAGRPTPVFGLPGNPVSSFVSFELLARPALRQMMGHREIGRRSVRAIADEGLPRPSGDGRTQWQRVHGTFGDDGRLHVTSTGMQASHQLANSAAANGLAEVPDGPGISPHGEVNVLLLT